MVEAGIGLMMKVMTTLGVPCQSGDARSLAGRLATTFAVRKEREVMAKWQRTEGTATVDWADTAAAAATDAATTVARTSQEKGVTSMADKLPTSRFHEGIKCAYYPQFLLTELKYIYLFNHRTDILLLYHKRF